MTAAADCAQRLSATLMDSSGATLAEAEAQASAQRLSATLMDSHLGDGIAHGLLDVLNAFRRH